MLRSTFCCSIVRYGCINNVFALFVVVQYGTRLYRDCRILIGQLANIKYLLEFRIVTRSFIQFVSIGILTSFISQIRRRNISRRNIIYNNRAARHKVIQFTHKESSISNSRLIIYGSNINRSRVFLRSDIASTIANNFILEFSIAVAIMVFFSTINQLTQISNSNLIARTTNGRNHRAIVRQSSLIRETAYNNACKIWGVLEFKFTCRKFIISIFLSIYNKFTRNCRQFIVTDDENLIAQISFIITR